MHDKRIKYYIIILLSALLMSCVSNRNTRYLQDIKGVSYPKNDSIDDYRIKKNDEINILVYSINSEGSQLFVSGSQAYSYLVYSDGTIDIPYVHKIKIEGLTILEAAHEIERRLKEHIPDAEVKIALARKYFYIIGDGNTKGEFPVYKDKLNIFEALALGGDLNYDANRKEIKIIREIGNDKTIRTIDLRSRTIIDSEYYYIQPNDIIYISRSRKSFYKITSFASFLGMISSSMTFVLLVSNYSK